MRITKPTKTDCIVIAAILVLLIVLIIPSTQAVWDGHFQLTIDIDAREPIDRESLVFATCWFEDEALDALNNPGVYEYGFRPPEFSGDGDAVIDVPASGRPGTWGQRGTYNHPEFLIVEYRLPEADNELLARKRFDIPSGRGPRSMTIDLP